jgi:hypothetical protein
MPTKPKSTSIAAAEKRTIKAEIKALQRSLSTMDRTASKEIAANNRAILKLQKAGDRLYVAYSRDTDKTHRRIAILQGRL